jgi:hypothetical protein
MRRLLLLASTLLAAATSPEEDLQEWLISRGAYLGATIRPAGNGLPRGVVASRDQDAGTIVGFLPFSAALPLPEHSMGWDNVADLARLAYDPASDFFVAGGYAPFWRTQPALEELLSFETLSESELDQLEVPALADEIRSLQAGLRHLHASLLEELHAEAAASQTHPAFSLTEAQFFHLSALLTTRAFAFPYGDNQCCQRLLLPGLDLLNTQQSLNAYRAIAAAPARVEIVLHRSVAAGEELMWPYHSENDPSWKRDDLVPRNDVQLLTYGMVNDSDSRLLSCDRAGWSSEQIFESAVPTDDEHPADMGGASAVRAEAQRLQTLLAGLGSIEGDRAALAGRGDSWDRGSVLLRWRVARKEALRRRAAVLEEWLATQGEL